VKPSVWTRLAPFHLQLANYVQYFDWQWARVLQGTQVLFSAARLPFTLLFTGLGIHGALEHFRKDRVSWWYVVTLFTTLSVALVFYLNFKYGFSIEDPMGDVTAHEVRERDYFFIVSFSIWGLWAGMGISSLWKGWTERLGGAYRKAAPILLLAAIPLVLNWSWASRAGDYSARDWAYNLLMSVEPHGILFTNGDNDTFPLWYLQEVEGIRRDVTVIVTSYLNIEWYAKQLRDLTTPCPEGVDPFADPTRIICQRPYTSEGSPGAEYVYRDDAERVRAAGKVPILMDQPLRPPVRSILALDDETIDRVALTVVPLNEPRAVDLGQGITAQISGTGYIEPWHQFALSIISTALTDRPVYFASSGNAATHLGLTPYVVRHGLAFKLNIGIPNPEVSPNIVELPYSAFTSVTGIFVDEERTQTLASEVFIHRNGLPGEWTLWPWRAVMGIPSYYSWVHYALFEAADLEGDSVRAEHHMGQVEAWARLRGIE
jgi:hypothetical protein